MTQSRRINFRKYLYLEKEEEKNYFMVKLGVLQYFFCCIYELN